MTRWLLIMVIALLAGCAPAGDDGDTGSGLSYTGPVEITMDSGQTLPGTDLRYVGNSPDGAQVSIGGQTSTRRIGDSLVWQGEMVDGARVELETRIVVIADDRLTAAGTVKVEVTGARPEAGPVDTSVAARYKTPVAYSVDRGDTIPGTTITFEGTEDQRARLSGLEGEPFRRITESIRWTGKLRDRLWLDLDLRVVLFTNDSLNVAGTADLWLAPQ